MKIRALGQIESGKRKAGALIFFYIKNLEGAFDILSSLGPLWELVSKVSKVQGVVR